MGVVVGGAGGEEAEGVFHAAVRHSVHAWRCSRVRPALLVAWRPEVRAGNEAGELSAMAARQGVEG